MADDEERKRRLEEQKVALDYVKHISTLATSVIVFSIAFTDRRHRLEAGGRATPSRSV
jgi:hypothetical protein